jgi:hypothetical protein
MANFPICATVTDKCGGSLIVAATSARGDRHELSAWYTLHTPDGELVASGLSRGYGGSGVGSMLTAMKAGKAAARRRLARMRHND